MSETSGTLSYAEQGTGIVRRFKAPYLVRLATADRMDLGSSRISLAEVERVCIGRGAQLLCTREHDGQQPILRLAIPDNWMSSKHLELCQEKGSWRVRDLASKNGSFRNGFPVGEAELEDGDLLHTGNSTFLFRQDVERSLVDPVDMQSSQLRGTPLAARSLSLEFARKMADLSRVAPSGVSVILGGETGTGKEVSARFLHQASGRPGNFVAVNCGALPENLVESELFGHRKGAFSGAQSDRIGLVQASDRGTLFLDEVAELPLVAQAKLLRVLQEKEVMPLGSTRPLPVDLRVVCATHANLPAMVDAGQFRADLYARLAGLCFELPPLRWRKEDIGILISTLLGKIAEDAAPEYRFEREAIWAIALYTWPRNIRELEQALSAAVAWSTEGVIRLKHLPAAVSATLVARELSDDEKLHNELVASLKKHQGNISAVAREMGKARVQIRRWCKKFSVDPETYR